MPAIVLKTVWPFKATVAPCLCALLVWWALTLSRSTAVAHFTSLSTAKRLHSSDLYKQKLLPFTDPAPAGEGALHGDVDNNNNNNNKNNNGDKGDIGGEQRNKNKDSDDLVVPVAVPGSASSRFNVDNDGVGTGGGGAIHSPTTFVGAHQPPLPLYRAFSHQRPSTPKAATLPLNGGGSGGSSGVGSGVASKQQPPFEERSECFFTDFDFLQFISH